MQLWVHRADGKPLDQVRWEDGSHAPHEQPVKTAESVENRILDARKHLAEQSDLGEYGAEAIRAHLLEQADVAVPSVATINRILGRRGAFDGKRRVRRTPPQPGWYLPEVAARRADIDEADFVEGLYLEGGQELCTLNLVSLHGGLCASWPNRDMRAAFVRECLLSHWRQFGLPAYAQFDNHNVFAGPRQHPGAVGNVILMCLSLRVTPVFAVPREFGIQSAIENYNNQWQQKVWQRYHFEADDEVTLRSDRYVSAVRMKRARRQEAAPIRHPFPADWQAPGRLERQGKLIFLRRTTDRGAVDLLGHKHNVDSHWCNRLVRCELDLEADKVRVFGLRRQEPQEQPMLNEWQYRLPEPGRKRPVIRD